MKRNRKKNEFDSLKNNPTLSSIQNYLKEWLACYYRYKKNKRANYKQPWFLLLGESNSGKSALLHKCDDLIKLVEPPVTDEKSPLTIWVNQQAVILEPDGQLVDQRYNQPFSLMHRLYWKQILNWLIVTREKQPLNGIILTIDVKHLLPEEKQRKTVVRSLITRLKELNRYANSQLPVYIVFNKLDQLEGFSACYHQLDDKQRQQLLGITFNATELAALQETINDFFNHWQDYLCQFISTQLTIEDNESTQTIEILYFSHLIALIHPQLLTIMEQLHSLTTLTHGFILRGCYFTSCHQGEVSYNPFLTNIAQHYKLPEHLPTTKRTTTSDYYFVDHLVNQVLFSEPQLASNNQRIEHKQRRHFTLITVAALTFSLVIMINWHYIYSFNAKASGLLTEKLKTMSNLQTAKPSSTNPLFVNDLDYRADILDVYNKLSTHRTLIPFIHIMPTVTNDVSESLQKYYVYTLKTLFLPALMQQLSSSLKEAPAQSEEKFTILKIMRMLEDETGRQPESIFDFTSQFWAKQYPNQYTLQESLTKHLDYLLSHLSWKAERDNGNKEAIARFAPFIQSIKDAQQELSHIPFQEKLYADFKTQGMQQLSDDLNLRTVIGNSYDYLFTAKKEELLYIPQMMTKDVFDNYFSHHDTELTKLAAENNWVLNTTKSDNNLIIDKIKQHYIDDYAETWYQAFANLELNAFDDLALAKAAISELLSEKAPLTQVLILLNKNTLSEFTQPKQGAQPNISPKSLALFTSYQQQLSALHAVIPKLRAINQLFQSMTSTTIDAKQAVTFLHQRLKDKKGDPFAQLQQLAKSAPFPLKNWFTQLVTELNTLIEPQVINALKTQWNNQVIKFYKEKIANRYPFNPNANQYVSLDDFDRFLGSDGILAKFEQQYLQFLRENQSKLIKINKKYQLNSTIVSQFKSAAHIRQLFYNKDKLSIEFTLQPLAMSVNKSLGILTIADKALSFKRGIPITDPINIHWPIADEKSGCKLILTDYQSNKLTNLSFSGPWAIFKMITAANMINKDGTEMKIRYDVDNGYIAYRLFLKQKDNPFSEQLFSQFKLTENLFDKSK